MSLNVTVTDSSGRYVVDYDELLEVAKRSRAVIYAISLGSNSSRTRVSLATPDFELRRLSQETGGRLLLAKDATSLSNLYDEIADELTSQYVLGYLSSNVEGSSWRSISVRVSRPNVQIRTRTGYFASQARAVDR